MSSPLICALSCHLDSPGCRARSPLEIARPQSCDSPASDHGYARAGGKETYRLRMSESSASSGRSGEMPPLTRGATIVDLNQLMGLWSAELMEERRGRCCWRERGGGGFSQVEAASLVRLAGSGAAGSGTRTGVYAMEFLISRLPTSSQLLQQRRDRIRRSGTFSLRSAIQLPVLGPGSGVRRHGECSERRVGPEVG